MKFLKHKIFFVFAVLLLESMVSFAQGTWTYSYALHNRRLNSLSITDYSHLCMVGGNKTNDSIQSIYTSSDAGNNFAIVTDLVSPWVKSVVFTSSNTGITVGDYGKILKTTDGGYTWNTIALNGIAGQRHYNSVFFTDESTGYAAGGIQLNDSASTIIKTIDGGETWTVLKDNPGYWFTSVHFPGSMTGYAVGDHGIFFKTIDGGNNWTQKTISGVTGSRDYTAVFFTNNNTGFIVGGNLTNDSIQTILKTNDGGNTWSVIRDNISPMLNDIFFYSSSDGYAVGNNGTVLHSTDAGNTWHDEVIPGNKPFFNFNAVRFLNPNYGYIVGNAGIIFRYLEGSGQGPIVQTRPATNVNLTSAQLNAEINANSYPTVVVFEYGTTTSYGNLISGVPDSVFGLAVNATKAVLYGLNPNTIYHYRAKASNLMANSYGQDFQFFTGNPTIPNFNFEIWDTNSMEIPDSVTMFGGQITKAPAACNGNFAVKLESNATYDSPGFILLGTTVDGLSFSGGFPFNARPDSIIACMEYDIIPNDTALIVLILKKNGIVISNNFFEIYGSSAGNFQELTFPITYTASETPDSIIFAAVTTDIRHITQLLLGSYLTLDNLHFSGTTESIPNYDFEIWKNFEHITLNSWSYEGKTKIKEFDQELPVILSNDAHSGNYAAMVRNIISPPDTVSGNLYSSNTDHQSFSINYKPNSLNGFYKFYPENGDSLYINISILSGTDWIGSGTFKTGDTVSDYTPFTAAIAYNQAVTPDSAYINIQVSKNNMPLGNSYALIDDFNFDGFLADVEENPMVKPANADLEFNIYPNPFSNNATISFTLDQPEQVQIRLYDISGNDILTIANKNFGEGDHDISFSGAGLQKGFYICMITTDKTTYSKKIIVY